jgi:hypothetical protein
MLFPTIGSDDVCVCAVLLLEEAVDVVAVVVVVLLLMMIMMMTAAIAGHKKSMALLQARTSLGVALTVDIYLQKQQQLQKQHY